MDPRIFPECMKIACLCLLAGGFTIAYMFGMAAEQEAREKRVAKLTIEPAWTFQDENQWGKFPEQWR